jgi:hypothetical protein
MGTQADKIALDIKSGGARRDRTADLLHAMQALSQLSYGPTWRRGTLPDRGQFVKKMNGLRAPGAAARAAAPQTPWPRRGAAASPACPEWPSVASMGGDTVPPHTARRSGWASLPSATPFARPPRR